MVVCVSPHCAAGTRAMQVTAGIQNIRAYKADEIKKTLTAEGGGGSKVNVAGNGHGRRVQWCELICVRERKEEEERKSTGMVEAQSRRAGRWKIGLLALIQGEQYFNGCATCRA